jgi:hypothetical protein
MMETGGGLNLLLCGRIGARLVPEPMRTNQSCGMFQWLQREWSSINNVEAQVI